MYMYMERDGAAMHFQWFSENQTKGSTDKSHHNQR